MDEEDEDDSLNAKPDASPKEAPPTQEKLQPEPQEPKEEEPPPDESKAECRFFTKSEWAQATPEQKAFIQECDRAAGRTGVTPTPASPPSNPPAPPTPQPKTPPRVGGVTCKYLTPSEAQSYLLPGDPYGLDRDHDGIPCEQ